MAARWRNALCLILWLAACADNPYVIGRYADAGAARDECSERHTAALVCSGFEIEGLADWPDTVRSPSGGTLERSTARAHSGSASLHATSNAARTTVAVARELSPLFSGELYLRAYLYIPADLPTEIMNLFFLGHEPDELPPEAFVGLDINLAQGAVQVYSPQNDPARLTGTLTVPRDRWFCFRVRIEIGDEDGELTAFVDDELALDAAPYDTLPDEGVHVFRAGIDWSSQEAFFEVFIDDLVLDTAPVQCR